MGYKIYLVEDEDKLNRLLTTYLENAGWQVKSFLTGEAARKVIREEPHMWILDIMLPDLDGYQLIGEIKEADPEVPVIFISARDADLDRIIGLEKGSDDYLAKPFSPRELVIRVQKLMERVYKSQEKSKVLDYNGYKIDPTRRMVINPDGDMIDLTSKEFDVLLYFCTNVHLALSREQILDQVWGKDYFGTDRVVDDLIRRLRKKLPGVKIETIYGLGYRLVKV